MQVVDDDAAVIDAGSGRFRSMVVLRVVDIDFMMERVRLIYSILTSPPPLLLAARAFREFFMMAFSVFSTYKKSY